MMITSVIVVSFAGAARVPLCDEIKFPRDLDSSNYR